MIKKPGLHKKKKHKLPKPPKELHCRGCNHDPKGVVSRWCHSESRLIKMKNGGGIMGGRINHKYIAWLCFDCDIKYTVTHYQKTPLKSN